MRGIVNVLMVFVTTVTLMSVNAFALDKGKTMFAPSTDVYDFTFEDSKNENSLVATLVKVDKIEQSVKKVLGLFPRVAIIEYCNDKGNKQYDCPIDEVACDASTDKVICPQGGKLNPDRDMCQVNPKIVCPNGYTWDKSIDKCISHNVCLSGGILNEKLDRCEKIVDNHCPNGYKYDTSRDVCWKKVVCLHGGSFNPSRDRCELTVTKSCPSGYNYISSTDRCERNPICPSGMYYNARYNKCLRHFIKSCPSGYSLGAVDGNSNQCQKIVNSLDNCPRGYSYNPATNRCRGGSACSRGSWNGSYCAGSSNYTYNASKVGKVDECRVALFFYGGSAFRGAFSAKTGTYFSKLPAIYCYSDGTIGVPGYPSTMVKPNTRGPGYGPGGVFLNYTKPTYKYTCPKGGKLSGSKCIKNSSFSDRPSCPAGNAGVTSDGKCYANPKCPSSSFANISTKKDKCYTGYSKYCPSGSHYYSSLDMCIKDASCPGGSLDTYRDKCFLSYSPTCSYGNYDNKNRICYSNPICSLGNYNSLANECRAKVTRYCGTNYSWDDKSRKCIDHPVCSKDSSFKYNSSINYSSTLNVCVSTTEHDCPSLYTYSSLPVEKCENVPICSEGVYDPNLNSCYKGDICPISPSISCKGPKHHSYCSPYSCNDNHKCGYAICQQGTPSPGYPIMNRNFFGIQPSKTATRTCYKQKCDLVKNKYISYCGQLSCPKGFGVYEKNGNCYKKACPNTTIEKNGRCYKLGCPNGYQLTGGNQCIKK